jgi:hypothetical protein
VNTEKSWQEIESCPEQIPDLFQSQKEQDAWFDSEVEPSLKIEEIKEEEKE